MGIFEPNNHTLYRRLGAGAVQNYGLYGPGHPSDFASQIAQLTEALEAAGVETAPGHRQSGRQGRPGGRTTHMAAGRVTRFALATGHRVAQGGSMTTTQTLRPGDTNAFEVAVVNEAGRSCRKAFRSAEARTAFLDRDDNRVSEVLAFLVPAQS